MTPTKESLDRAELWCKTHGLTYFDPELVSDVADPAHVESLALEFDRVAIEAAYDAAKAVCPECRGGSVPESDGWHWVQLDRCRKGESFCKAWNIMRTLRDQLVEYPRQGAAHDAEGGESE